MSDEFFLKMIQGAALCDPATLRSTMDFCRLAIADGVQGDFVECGVFAGVQCAVMSREALREGKGRKVHLFDSFEGIPEAGPHDDKTITALIGEGSGRLISTGVSACSMSQVVDNMKLWGVEGDHLHYHIGWFQDSLPRTISYMNRGIAVLRLDGDLYESTRVCLNNLAWQISKGGYLIVDDYALTGCRKAVHEYFAGIENGVPFGPAYYRKNA